MLNKLEMLRIYFFGVLVAGGRCLAIDTAGYKYIPDACGWLRLHDLPATRLDAQFQCSLEGGTLASPTTSTLTEAMKTMMNEHGLTIDAVFTNINPRSLGMSLLDITLQWTDGEPDNQNSDENCLVMTKAGKAADKSCVSEYPYFCHKDQSKYGITDRDYKFEQRTGSFYKLHTESRTWCDAAAACSTERAHLAVINSEIEYQVLNEFFNKYSSKTGQSTNTLFLGFSDPTKKQKWTTIFGDTLVDAGYAKWASTPVVQPDNYKNKEYCGSINEHGLNDIECDLKKPFICEINLN